MPFRTTSFICLWLFFACSPGPEKSAEKKTALSSGFQFKETIVQPSDTLVQELKGFKRKNPDELFYQVWQMVSYDKAGNRKAKPEGPTNLFALYSDSTAFTNISGDPVIAKWFLHKQGDKQKLQLIDKKLKVIVEVESISATQLVLISRQPNGDYGTIEFEAEGLAHKNPKSDPFHPSNAAWLIHPSKAESDSAIRLRVERCLRFYALYFRDNIKRKKDKISFAGLPDAFDWYQGGIVLPDRHLVSNAWISCFYNEEQSLKGYDMLRRLMKDYDFEWPDGAPDWVYRTHSVLEQMYLKFKSMPK